MSQVCGGRKKKKRREERKRKGREGREILKETSIGTESGG
jgi:hypothetical protein